MSDTGPQAGVAHVRIIPSMRDFSKNLAKQLTSGMAGPARKAGDAAGDEMGEGIAKGVSGKRSQFSSVASTIGDIFKAGLATAGIAAGVALTAGLGQALDIEQSTDKLAAQLNLTADEAERVGNLSSDIFAGAWGDSIGEVNGALRGVISELGSLGATSDAELKTLTTQAIDLGSAFDQDVNEVIRASSALLSNELAGSAEEALDIVAVGLQQAGVRGDDVLETFSEYSNQFRSIGIDGTYALSLLSAGLGAGARNTDVLADSIKEMWIKVKDGEQPAVEALTELGFGADEVAKAFADGGDVADMAMQDVLTAILEVEDETERGRLATALMGTTFEQVGDEALAAMARAEPGVEGLATAADDVSTRLNDNLATTLESLKRGALTRLADFVNKIVIPALEGLAAVVGPPLRVAMDAVSSFWSALTTGGGGGSPIEDLALRLRDAFDFVPGIIEDVQAFWAALTTGMTEDEGSQIESIALAIRDFGSFLGENQELIIGALAGIGIVIAATLLPAMISLAASVIAATWPFIAIAAAAAAVGAGIMWLYNNVESFRNFVDAAIPMIAQIFSDAFALIQVIVQGAVAVIMWLWRTFGDELLTVIQIAWDLISGVVMGALNIIQGIIRTVTAVLTGDWSGAWEGIKQITSGAVQIVVSILQAAFRLIGVIVRVAWDVIKAVFRAGWNLVSSLVSSGVNRVLGYFRRLPGQIRSAFSTLASAISAPFRSAFNAVKSLWNSTAGGFGFSIPSWVPKVGGNSFKIPSMHTGGIVPGPPGSEQLILAQAGEGMISRRDMSELGRASTTTARAAPVEIELKVTGTDREMARLIRRMVKDTGGGNVQLAFGSSRGG